ncbi:MAG: HAD-IC family P-type ATPase [Polyangiaceae bacterium]|nr:HAD-IC family P-type ATPase [Polyangiaceae bacterium]
MRAAGPVVDPVPCSACGKLIDPLRAGHVAIFDQKLHYFCNRDVCRASFLGEPIAEPPPPELEREDAFDALESAAPIEDAFQPRSPDEGLANAPPALDGEGPIEPLSRMILHDGPTRIEPQEGRDVGALLLVLAIVAGTLAVSLSLLGTARLTIVARIVLAGVGALMLLGRALTTERDASDANPLPVLVAPLGSVAVALWASFGKDAALAGEATSLAGFIVTAGAVGAWLIDHARRTVAGERAWLESHLAVPGRRAPSEDLRAEGHKRDKVFDIKPGEHVVMEPGEVVPVDLTIVDGEVEVLPWTFATTPVWRKVGDPLVAGATVVSGRLRGVCTWAGADRAFARVVLDPRRRADAFAPVAKASRALVERWSFVAAFVGGLSAFVAGRIPVEIAMAAIAVHAALSTPIAASIAAVHVARGVLLALRRGIVYKSSDAWELSGRVQTAVFCARGTLLKGEPELSEVIATTTKVDETDVLALASGAERMAEDPIANAIVRAARLRQIRPDGVRNPQTYPGLGVTAISSTGQELVVGSRALLLEEHVSIASIERTVTELESQGRSVVLAAVAGRLVGVIALIDGLRPGARAAVQHLLDAEIEPIIMSGDSRETCDAIARSLDIEHVRPEVLPAERPAEVRRVMDTGVTVAVLGHSGVDDDSLATADVAVALGAAGSAKPTSTPATPAPPKLAAPGDFAVTLASDDVRDAALALALARRVRTEARVGVAIAAVPALIGSVAVAFGLLPPAYAPIASLLGSVMATVHARALEGKR